LGISYSDNHTYFNEAAYNSIYGLGNLKRLINSDEDEYKIINTFGGCKYLENIFYKFSINTQLTDGLLEF
jgi:hypothetical protein